MSSEPTRPVERTEPTEKGDTPRPGKPGGKSVEEKVGRTLGRAVLRLKQTRVWRDTAKAYQEGLEGKR